MSRILITGVDGFTGRYLAPMLAAHGHEVHGLVRHPLAASEAGLDGVHALHVCDMLDAHALKRLVNTLLPQKVCHLAAIAFVAHGDVESIYRTNIVGAHHLLSALGTSETPPETVLLASSANVYGNATEGVIDELVRPAPANDYAVSKLAMEYMAATWNDRLPITLVRPFNYTGVGQSVDFLLPKIVSHCRRRAPILELGNLDVTRDLSDVRMVVDCYRRLLDKPQPGRVFNVCSGNGHTLRSVLQMACELSGHSPEIRINPSFVRSNEVHTLIGSRAALEAAIGPIRGPTLRETLQWMLA
jgi:nucleoside-diphosphate-sugar epimerase